MEAEIWRVRRARARHGVWISMQTHTNDPFKRGDLLRNISGATQTRDLATWRAVRRLASQNESGRKWRKILDAFRPSRREGRLFRELARHAAKREAEANRAPAKSKRPLCGARCRSGQPCKARVCERPGGKGLAARCRLHGGKSTGPKTEAGRAAIAAANRARSKH